MSNENQKPVWHRNPKIKPSHYGKHRSLLPPTRMKDVLLHYNMTEERLLHTHKHILSNQQEWTKKIHNLQKKAFIIRQLLQQEILKARGINCRALLPQIVIEAHKYLAQSELMKMTYLGAKHLPMHGRMRSNDKAIKGVHVFRLYELQKYEDQMYDKSVKLTTAEHNKKVLHCQQHQQECQEPSSGHLNHTTKLIMEEFMQKNTSIQSDIIPVTFKSASIIVTSESDNDTENLYTKIENKSKQPDTNSNGNKFLKGSTSLLHLPTIDENPEYFYSVPRAISMPATPVQEGNDLNTVLEDHNNLTLPHILPASKKQKVTAHKRHNQPINEQRFVDLQRALTQLPNKTQLSFNMLSPASWDKTEPISPKNQHVIKTKYQPRAKSRLDATKIYNALELAKQKGKQE